LRSQLEYSIVPRARVSLPHTLIVVAYCLSTAGPNFEGAIGSSIRRLTLFEFQLRLVLTSQCPQPSNSFTIVLKRLRSTDSSGRIFMQEVYAENTIRVFKVPQQNLLSQAQKPSHSHSPVLFFPNPPVFTRKEKETKRQID
jgi:hypothetical protein